MSIIFRVDSNNLIGTGHFSRCYQLAKYLMMRKSFSNLKIAMISRQYADNLAQSQSEIPVHYLPYSAEKGPLVTPEPSSWLGADELMDAQETITILQQYSNIFLILDHYGITERWEQMVRPYVHRILCINEISFNHQVDYLLNQYALSNHLSFMPPYKYLVGPQWAFIKPAIVECRISQNIVLPPRTILISFGGADPSNQTERIVRLISRFSWSVERYLIVVGSAYQFLDTLQEQIRTIWPQSEEEKDPLEDQSIELKALGLRYEGSSDQSRVQLFVNCPEMQKIYQLADLCLGSIGISTYERMCMGVINCLITIADNQEATAQHLADQDLACYLGRDHQLTNEQIINKIDKLLLEDFRPMIDRGQQLVDGQGLSRISRLIFGNVFE